MVAATGAPWDGLEGEAAATMRAVDWSRTPLGPVTSWSGALRAAVDILLHSRHPMFLWWGPELTQIYNDAYLPSFGRGKHPAAMGQAGRDCWQEIWPIIWPQIDDVMTRGLSSWNEDQFVPIWRNGRIEDVWWTYGYSPVREADGSIGGTLVVCTETTPRVLSERRLRSGRDLVSGASAAHDLTELVVASAQALACATEDVPRALVCLRDEGGALRVTAEVRVDESLRHLPQLEAIAARVRAEGALHMGRDEAARVGLAHLEHEVFVAPVHAVGGDLEGLVVYALRPSLPFDAAYRDHLLDLAAQIARAKARIELLQARSVVERERMNLLMQAPIATAVLLGPEHTYELANPRYCAIVGRTQHQLVGKGYFDAFPELRDTQMREILARVYATGEPFVTNEMHVQLEHDGAREDKWFKFNLEPIRNTEGRVYGMMAIAGDITAQVRARRVVEEAHAERERFVLELQEASRTKDAFLAMLGHELRNPLSPILTALQLMKLRGDDAHAREHAMIERQVRHMVRLVDDLLDISRITGGKVALKKDLFEIATVIAAAIEQTSPLLEQKGHVLTVDVPPLGLTVEGDPVRLAQVLSNVIHNAAKYTDDGGRIGVSARRSGQDVVVRVRDNGRGIAPDVLPVVFELFTQERQNLDRSQGGLGLGLAIARSLVVMHGGSIEARSPGAGQGSEVTVRLPWSEARAPAADGARAQPAAREAELSARVLIVDDNRDAADMLAELVRVFGYEAHVAYDGPSGLAVAAEHPPDIALLDIGLPVMDGYELAQRLQAQAAERRGHPLTIVAVTGYGQPSDRARAEALGFARHVVKPIDPTALEQALREITASRARTRSA